MKLLSLIALLFIHPYVNGQKWLTIVGNDRSPILGGGLLVTKYNKVSSWKELKWSDFIGKSDGDEKILAMTVWNISLGEEWIGHEMSFTVLPEFVANKSFTRTSDSAVLSHEQYHYALVELYTAKIQRAIAPYHLLADHKKVEKIYDSLCNKLRKMQDLYDMETANSRNKTTQRLWEKNIDHELSRLQ